MEGAVVARDLTKIYREGRIEVTGVTSVSLQLNEKEVVGLVGPAGSGKTTLLSLIGCILRPTKGTLSLYGTEIKDLSERFLPGIRKKYISFIFQRFNLFSALTAYENILIALKLKGMGRTFADRRAKEVLMEVGLSEKMHFYPLNLSMVDRQKVAIACALASDSPIILADEPTGNLDFINGVKLMEIFRRLSIEKNKSVLVATHDIRIEGIFDRILLMQDGEIIKEKRIRS
ncbi:MAG: ABC transporter ATP-binding protein [Nitrospirota bacterium]